MKEMLIFMSVVFLLIFILAMAWFDADTKAKYLYNSNVYKENELERY